jgi:hypothetical protein
MERFNIFQQEYKDLKTLLDDTAVRIQNSSFLVPEETNDVVREVAETISFLTIYHEQEEQVILSLLFELEPAVVDEIKIGQRKLAMLAGRITNAFHVFQECPEDEEKTEAAKEIYASFNKFAIASLQLMGKKDYSLNQILWRYFSDKHLKDIHRELVQKTAIKKIEETNKWHLHDIPDTDVVSWLKSASETAPEKTFHKLLAIAKKQLPGHQFNTMIRFLAKELELA